MVHARYGSKDAILDTLFAPSTRRNSAPPQTRSSGLQQALAHVDRIRELYAEDCDLLRAIFVLTFEAATATSPAGPRIRMWLERAAQHGRGGTPKRHRRWFSAIDIDMDRAVNDSVLPFLAPRTNGSCRHIRTTCPRDRVCPRRLISDYGVQPPSEQARRDPRLGSSPIQNCWSPQWPFPRACLYRGLVLIM